MKMCDTLAKNGTIDNEETYHTEYEKREFNIVMYRILPLNIVITACSNFLLGTFCMTLNFSYYHIYICLVSLYINI